MRLSLTFAALAAALCAHAAPLDDASSLLVARRSAVDGFSAHFARRDDYLGSDILTPNATGGVWTRGFEKARELVNQMTIEEAINITTGFTGFCVGYTGAVPRLNVEPLCLQDGPAGVRPSRGVSQFPAAITAGATWSRRLLKARAEAMAQEFRDRGVNVALSPVTGSPLGRSPLGGRNWEGFSADSYLSSVASYITIHGMQSNGLATTAKHYLLNEQETRRRPYNRTEPGDTTPAPEGQSVNEVLDDRTTHELYLYSFAEAVRAGTAYIMSSYNRINGTQASADALSQNYILKGILGFEGSIMSDWGGTHDNVAAWNGGMDVTMPGTGYSGVFGSFGGESLLADVQAGRVPEWRIRDAAIRTLGPAFQLQDEQEWPEVSFDVRDTTRSIYPSVRKPKTAALIREIGEEAVVLLKNNRSAGLGLPLKPRDELHSLAVLGEGAFAKNTGWTSCGQGGHDCVDPSQNGTLTLGGGSGWVYPSYILDGASVMQHEARRGSFDVNLDASNGFANLSNFETQARVSEAALVWVNAFQTEGNDRPNMTLFGAGDALVKAAAAQNNNTVVIINSGGPVLVEEWIDHPNVTAVLFAFFPGQEGAASLPDILFGDKSPSGKLPFTMGKSLDQYIPDSIADDPDIAPVAEFKEGTLGGDWHYFEAMGHEPRYAFGHGLSYTTFAFSDVSVAEAYAADSTSVQKTNEKWSAALGAESGSVYDTLLEVTATVKNTGKTAGAEVAQLYVTFPPTEGRPARQLRGFEKVHLQPGEAQQVTFALRRKDLSVWSTVNQHWLLLSGDYTFAVGGGSDRANVSATFAF